MLFSTALLNGSGNLDMLLAGAFVYIYFISLFSLDGDNASAASGFSSLSSSVRLRFLSLTGLSGDGLAIADYDQFSCTIPLI